MVVCKQLCAHTNNNNVDFFLIHRFLGHIVSDFKYWYQCHQKSSLISNINFLTHIAWEYRFNILACVKAEIKPMLRNLHFSYIVQNRSGVVMFTYSILIINTKHTQLPNIDFITCSKTEI